MKTWINSSLLALGLSGVLGACQNTATTAAPGGPGLTSLRLIDVRLPADALAASGTTGGQLVKAVVTPASQTWDAKSDADGRCLGSAIEMQGGSWSAGVTAGGLTETTVPAVNPRTRGAALGASLTMSGAAGRVQVLIVDHFNPVPIRLREPGMAAVTYQVAHGNLVLAHLRAVLTGAGYARTLTASGDQLYTKDQSVIELRKVEVDRAPAAGVSAAGMSGLQVRTSAVVQKLEAAIGGAGLRDQAAVPRPDRIVVNMSLAMLPCALMQNYAAAKATYAQAGLLYRLNDYLHDLYTQNPGQYSELEFDKAVLNPPDLNPNEPLRKFVTDLRQKHPNAVFVASAGNYGLPISTMPAAWQEVVSVGAATDNGQPAILHPGDQPWPDVGDVMEVGQWLQLRPEDWKVGCTSAPYTDCALSGVPADSALYRTLKYRGTSFATPTVTAYIAMSALAQPQKCLAAQLPNQFWPAQTKLANLWLPDAIAKSCP